MTENQVPDEPVVLRDSDGAVNGHIENMHKVRYIEMFLAGREASTGNLVAACYNTMYGDWGIPDSKDTAPQELVAGIDFDQLKAEYNLLGASLNGPKIWTPDWSDCMIGKVREFNGIKAPWVAQLTMEKAGPVADTTPYEPMMIYRDSALGWPAGTKVMLLDDAEGNTWIMKGFQLGLEPRFEYEDFLENGASYFEKLPAGWRFRVVTLEKELIEKAPNGDVTIMSDEFFNVYDKTGPDQMNYQP